MSPFLKVERAKSVVLNGRLLILKRCLKCSVEFYGEEIHMKCEDCRKRKKKLA